MINGAQKNKKQYPAFLSVTTKKVVCFQCQTVQTLSTKKIQTSSKLRDESLDGSPETINEQLQREF